MPSFRRRLLLLRHSIFSCQISAPIYQTAPRHVPTVRISVCLELCLILGDHVTGWRSKVLFSCVCRARLNVVQGANFQGLLRRPGRYRPSVVLLLNHKSIQMNCITIWHFFIYFRPFPCWTLCKYVFLFSHLFIYLFTKTVLVWTFDQPSKRFILIDDAVHFGHKKYAAKFLC